MRKQKRGLPVANDADLEERAARDLEEEMEVLQEAREEDVQGVR